MGMHDDSVTRWGVIGTGGIAAAFLTDLAYLPSAQVVSVGSRSTASAQGFADRFGIENRYGSYEELVNAPEVDVVYVATPHPLHHMCAMLAIKAGKACLVEKPMTINLTEAASLVAAARAGGTFLMEAMWTRFLPHVVRIRELIAAGRLGEVRSFMADFGERVAEDPTNRAYAPELGGGALLDLGIYPLSFASMLFGAPTQVCAVSTPAFTGVDGQTSVILRYAQGQQALLFASLDARTPNGASINGTKGRIEIAGDFLAPSTFRLIPEGSRTGETIESYEVPHQGRGLRHQAAEVGRCLRAGLLESPVMPLDESLTIMTTLDEIRSQIGLVYPSDARPAALADF
jgi:predicted dehydrogenase